MKNRKTVKIFYHSNSAELNLEMIKSILKYKLLLEF